jgi:hypothetical protein
MKYLELKWEESRGDKYDNWGTSIWFLELDLDNYPLRQIEVYQNGKRLKYDKINFEDEFGMLGDQSMDSEEIEEMNGITITLEQFETEWLITNA